MTRPNVFATDRAGCLFAIGCPKMLFSLSFSLASWSSAFIPLSGFCSSGSATLSAAPECGECRSVRLAVRSSKCPIAIVLLSECGFFSFSRERRFFPSGLCPGDCKCALSLAALSALSISLSIFSLLLLLISALELGRTLARTPSALCRTVSELDHSIEPLQRVVTLQLVEHLASAIVYRRQVIVLYQ